MSLNSDLSGYPFERQTPAALLENELTGALLRNEERGSIGVSSLTCLFSDDLTLREICEMAYRMRDAEIQSEDR
jgi:hypothetical protein